LVALAALDREGAQAIEQPALPALVEQLLLRDEVDGPADAAADDERVEEAAVVRRQDDGTLLRDVLAAGALEREVRADAQAYEEANRPEERLVHTLGAGALVIAGETVHRAHWQVPAVRGGVTPYGATLVPRPVSSAGRAALL